MPEHPWFVIEPEDDEDFEFTDDERAFAAALRERTAGWASAGVGGELARTDAWDSLVAHLSFSDPGAGSICSTRVCTSPGTASAETVCTTSCSP
jgi:hypothetical protein